MCLYIKKSTKLKTAENDITCYKIVKKYDYEDNWFHTYYQHFPILIGRIYLSDIEEDSDRQIGKGLHSFTTLRVLKNVLKSLGIDGIHIKIAKCIIPKGAHYYKGNFEGEGPSYTSDKIKYIQIVGHA